MIREEKNRWDEKQTNETLIRNNINKRQDRTHLNRMIKEELRHEEMTRQNMKRREQKRRRNEMRQEEKNETRVEMRKNEEKR